MKGSLFDSSWKFMMDQLRNNIGKWFFLCLKVYLFSILIGVGFVSAIAVLTGSYFIVGLTPAFWIVSFMPLLLKVVAFVGGLFLTYKLLVLNVSFMSVPLRNCIDVAQNKPMRGLGNRVQLFSLVALGCVKAVVVILGFVCLILPGIIFMIRFSMARQIILDKKCGAFEALGTSWGMTRGKEIQLWFVLFDIIPFTGVINIFVPFYDLMLAKTYVDLGNNSSRPTRPMKKARQAKAAV